MKERSLASHFLPGRLKERTWERGVTTTYSYDQGSLESVSYTNDPTNTADVFYTYDSFGRQKSVTEGSGGTANTHFITYAYDFMSRRISKTIDSGTPEHYLYDGWNLIAKYTGTTLAETYVWGLDLSGFMQGAGGVGGLLAVNDGSATYYPTYDGNGNVSEYLDSGGAIQAHYEYDPFGNTTVSTGSKSTDFFHRFSTKPLDAETGLYYYGYRYYEPVTGRWPSRDPIEEEGGLNLYGFLENDGQNYQDFLGEKKTSRRGRKITTYRRIENEKNRKKNIVKNPKGDPKVVEGEGSTWENI